MRKLLDHEEIRRHITVVGIKSFKSDRKQHQHPMAVIGAGHIGLRHRLWFLKNKMTNFVIAHSRSIDGGTSWIAQANTTSKLQTESGAQESAPTRDQLLECFQVDMEEYGVMPYIKVNTNVKRVEVLEKDSTTDSFHIESTDGDYKGVDPPRPTGRGIEQIVGSVAFYYPGNS